VAEIENSNWLGNVLRRCLTIVVLPEPEGAENIISFPLDIGKDKQIFAMAMEG
jgi:hypothetical protein